MPKQALGLVFATPFFQHFLRTCKLLWTNDAIKRLRSPDPFFLRIVVTWRFQLLAGAVVDHRPLVDLVAQAGQDAARSPAAAGG